MANEDETTPDPAAAEGDARSEGRGSSRGRKAWHTRHLWQIQPVRDVLVVLSIVGLLYLGYVLRTVTVPMLAALLLAYLFEPLVQRLEQSKFISRQGAVAGIIVAIVALVSVPTVLGTAFAVVQGRDIWEVTNQRVRQISAVTRYVTEEGATVRPWRQGDDPETDEVEPATLLFFERPPPEPDVIPEAEPQPEQEPEQEAGQDAEPAPEQPADADATSADATPADEAVEPLADPRPTTPRVVTERARGASAAFDDLPPLLQTLVYWYITDIEPTEDGEGTTAQGGVVAEAIDWLVNTLRGNAGGVAGAAVEGGRFTLATALGTLASVGLLLFSLFLTGFFFFFFSTGWAKVRGFGVDMIPEKHRETTLDLVGQMDRVIAGFVRGRFTIALIQSVYFIIAYWLIGVPAPLILGPIVGVLSVVPYVALIGIPLTVIAMAIDNSGWLAFQQTWWWTLFAPVVVYQLGQLLDDYVLTPAIQGKTTNMDTPTILFASIAGGILAGIYGLLLAIPVAACAKILLRELFWPRFHAWLRGDARDFLPIRR
ncbi:MAG: AI-2E family transporter [Planctomycetota bacterium]